MTLSVTRNSNGTITIECGGDSLTIALPVASGTPHPNRGTSGKIPVLWTNGGATALIVDSGKAKTKIVPVLSEDELLRAIREQHDLHAKAPKPTIFQFHIKGEETLRVEKINKALSDLGDPSWMGAQI